MGCLFSLHNRIQIQHSFNADEILYLTQTWSILKNHDIVKFADEILIKIINQNPLFRDFWVSKINVEGNNFDFSQGDSCLRTDRSWHIGIREHSRQLVLFFDQLLSAIKDENLLLTRIRSFRSLQSIFIFEYDYLITMKQCILEEIHDRFQMFQYDFTTDYQRTWEKFLTFIIKYLLEKTDQVHTPTQIIISPATVHDQTSIKRVHSVH